MPSAPARPPSPKRDAILAAALGLFRRYGFRRTSIDQIAAEAQVAKPTIYAHFTDKDELFVAACQRVMDTILDEARAASAREADLAARLTAMLAAKFSFLFGLVHTSPHAPELLDSKNSLARQVVEDADARFRDLLIAEIERAVRARELPAAAVQDGPAAFARLLMQLGHGAGYGADSSDAHRENLARLVRALLGPPRGAARTRSSA